MAVDASSGRMTEIDYMNGYLVSLAERLNIPTPHHEMVIDMVKFTAEVTGLQYETGTRNRQAVRVAQRQNAIKDKIAKSNQETRNLDPEETEVEQKKEQDRERRRARRREKKRMRIDQHKQASMENRKDYGRGEGSSDPILTTTMTKSGDESSASPVVEDDQQVKAATLAHLEQLVRTGSRQSTREPADKPEAEDEEASEETEEQAEAIKELESRIFSRSGRRGF